MIAAPPLAVDVMDLYPSMQASHCSGAAKYALILVDTMAKEHSRVARLGEVDSLDIRVLSVKSDLIWPGTDEKHNKDNRKQFGRCRGSQGVSTTRHRSELLTRPYI